MNRFLLLATVALLVGVVLDVRGETELRPITESSVMLGRGGRPGGTEQGSRRFFEKIVVMGEVGIRQSRLSDGAGYGLSILVGRDFPNEASLVGIRGRLSHRDGQSTLEPSVALISTSAGRGIGRSDSFGICIAVAYYPMDQIAFVVQVDTVPIYVEDPEDPLMGKLTREPGISAGIRLAEMPGMAGWFAGGLGYLAYLFGNAMSW